MAGFFRDAGIAMRGSQDMMDWHEARKARAQQARRMAERDQWEREDRAHQLARRPLDDAYEDWRRQAERKQFDYRQKAEELRLAAVDAARSVMAGDFSKARELYRDHFPDGNDVAIVENADGSIDMRFSNGVVSRARDRTEFLFGREDGQGLGFLGLFEPKMLEQAYQRRQQVSDKQREFDREEQAARRRFGESAQLERMRYMHNLSDPSNWHYDENGVAYRALPDGRVVPVMFTNTLPLGQAGPPEPPRPFVGAPSRGRFGNMGAANMPFGNSAEMQKLAAAVRMARARSPELARLSDDQVAAIVTDLAAQRAERRERMRIVTSILRTAATGPNAFKRPDEQARAASALVDAAEAMAGIPPEQQQPMDDWREAPPWGSQQPSQPPSGSRPPRQVDYTHIFRRPPGG